MKAITKHVGEHYALHGDLDATAAAFNLTRGQVCGNLSVYKATVSGRKIGRPLGAKGKRVKHDLSAVSSLHAQLTALREQEAKIKERIAVEEKQGVERTSVLSKIRKAVVKYGITHQELKGFVLTSGKPAKYRDPASGAVWTGIGHAPQWIRGKDYSDFKI